KGIGGPFQGARCPPGVVVAERHIGRVRVRHTGVTGRAADVSSQTHQSDIGKLGTHGFGGFVLRGVVHHHHGWTGLQRTQTVQGSSEFAHPVTGCHHDGDWGPCRVRHGRLPPPRTRGRPAGSSPRVCARPCSGRGCAAALPPNGRKEPSRVASPHG